MDAKKDAAVVKKGLTDAEILISEKMPTHELISWDTFKKYDARTPI